MRRMPEWVLIGGIILLCSLVISGVMTIAAQADTEEYASNADEIPFIRMHATAYCYGTTRCDGKPVRKGICAAKPEWYGKTAAIYEDAGGVPGEFIGYYECLDTGGDAIKSGDVIDIYSPSEEWCIQFGRRNVLVFLIDGVG